MNEQRTRHTLRRFIDDKLAAALERTAVPAELEELARQDDAVMRRRVVRAEVDAYHHGVHDRWLPAAERSAAPPSASRPSIGGPRND